MKKGNRFEVGSGVYTCEVCGKRTRSTGRGDNENVGLCAKCYDEAGEENEHSDRGHEEYRETCPTCREEREKAETAKKKGPQYREKVELNKAQVGVLGILHEMILLEDGLGERFVAEHEYKMWELNQFEGSQTVFLSTEVGHKGDEGTMAALLARTRRHMAIGTKGGVKLLGAKDRRGKTKMKKTRKSPIRGLSNAVRGTV